MSREKSKFICSCLVEKVIVADISSFSLLLVFSDEQTDVTQYQMQKSREKLYSNNILNDTTISNSLEQMDYERSDSSTVESSSVHSR